MKRRDAASPRGRIAVLKRRDAASPSGSRLHGLVHEFVDGLYDVAQRANLAEAIRIDLLLRHLLKPHDEVDGVNRVEIELGEQIDIGRELFPVTLKVGHKLTE